MRIKTSTPISEADRAANEQRLRQAGAIGPNETLEVVVDPTAPSVEDLAAEASEAPEGDSTVC